MIGGDRSARGRLGSALRGAGPAARATLAVLRRVADGRVPPVRRPYVQGISSTSATIAWVGEDPSPGRVEYGEDPSLGREEVDGRVGRRHAVTLSGLVPGSTYHYRVAGVSSAAGSFRTAPVDEDARFTFAVIGDGGDGGKAQMAVAGLLEGLAPDLVLHAGDVVYPSGKQRHYDRRFFAPYRKIIAGTPVFAVPGNHDVATKNGAAFLENFHSPRENPRNTRRYYSFAWGGVHFVALDSELYHDDRGGSPEEQKAWLGRDLSAAARRPWKVVFLHRPLYGSSKHGGDRRIREDLEPLLVRHGVDLVFAGHDHVYERTKPIGGITHVVSGGGGKRLYPAGRSTLTARSASAHHAVLVRVEGGRRLHLEALRPDGVALDRFDLEDGGGVPPAPPGSSSAREGGRR